MRLQINKGEFMKNWQIAERSTSSKSTINSLTGILLKASGQDDENTVRLEATDLKTSVKCISRGILVEEEEKRSCRSRSWENSSKSSHQRFHRLRHRRKRPDYRGKEPVQVHHLPFPGISNPSRIGKRSLFLLHQRFRAARTISGEPWQAPWERNSPSTSARRSSR